MMMISVKCVWTRTRTWILVAVVMMMVMEAIALSGPNVCMVKQKYNITKRIKYRAPMSVRTYEWCFSMPPRCSRWNTEMRDLTRLETEERTAEVAVCCPGYKMKEVSCVPICPNGKTGPGCSEDCQPNRWGPNCVNECKDCSDHGVCSPINGECVCQQGWQGESCENLLTTTTSTTPAEDLLNTSKAATKPTTPSTTALTLITSSRSTVEMIVKTSTTTTAAPTELQIETKTQRPLSNKKQLNVSTSTVLPTQPKTTSTYKIVTTSSENPTTLGTYTEATTKSNKEVSFVYNRTEVPVTTRKSTDSAVLIPPTTQLTTMAITPVTTIKLIPTTKTTTVTTTQMPKTTTTSTTIKELPTTATPKIDTTTRKTETTRISLTTLKFKPKEIWIRPAQKGQETPTVETKVKVTHEVPHTKYKNATMIEIIPNTTPKTIIVSIIPTSVSYATFKKIALSTTSYISNKNVTVFKSYSKSSEGTTKAMSVQTTTMAPITKPSTNVTTKSHFTTTTHTPTMNVTKPTPHRISSTKGISTKSVFVNNTTNSMTRTSTAVTQKLNSSISLTTVTIPSTNIPSSSHRRNITIEKAVKKLNASKATERATTTVSPNKHVDVKKSSNKTVDIMQTTTKTVTVKNVTKVDRTNDTKATVSKSANSKTNTVTTDKPSGDEETFHILTEPEHITAVMTDKGTERSSVDLVSVISIAGGVMMAVITVAVIIVMIERCKKPRYEDVRKINDIRMQVMIDNNDVPPPYVRSIFHTPLPDPPNSEKCHYQPISTLDRNLKQFMRPVVVQQISPVMLENFRGILECHYDHLPRRSHEFTDVPRKCHDFGSQQMRCSVTPSITISEQLNLQRASLTESAIEALKCEAKLDVIDTTTAESEPLYAEIPCWRPPSEHAVEIINMNGEAVTEL
ncbi:mucin-2 isoform X1 [Ostrinia nubilalis]|uniref:mucin-2 isoform X1 n=1 Tax=Ostrinia nubilalis TaxID=29057 RepID=UPI0030825EF9